MDVVNWACSKKGKARLPLKVRAHVLLKEDTLSLPFLLPPSIQPVSHRIPLQGENSATGGRHPPISVTEVEALIQRVGITVEQFKEVMAALTLNHEVVVEDATREPAGGKAGPVGSGGKKKMKVRRSQKKKATKPNGKAIMEDELSRLDEEDESSSFERASAFDWLGDLKLKKPWTSAFDWLQDTRSAQKGDLREKLKEQRGESSATSKVGSEERSKAIEDKEAIELWRMYDRLEKRLDAQIPYCQAVFSEVTPFSRRVMSCPLPHNFKTPQIKAYNGMTDPQDHLARLGANVVMYAYPEEIKCRSFLAMLERQACEWFHKLPKGSIDKWSDLSHKFLEHFASSRRAKYLALEEKDDEPPILKEKKSGQPVGEGRKRKDFGNHYSEGWVGDGTHRLWLDMEFTVVQLDCAHHLIIGRPGLEDLECVISPVHLCMKFVTPTGIGIARGNRSLSRSCYVRATKSQARVDENVSKICATIQKEEGRPRAEPTEEVEEVALDPAKPEQKGPEDMHGVDPRIICHRLAVDPAHKLVKQKKRFLSSGRRDFITKQVTTLQSIGHIWEVRYPEWLANGGGVVAISPEGFEVYYSVRFHFKVSNNEAEYEALLCGLRLAASLKAERIEVRCDSKLIVGHVTGEFEAKDERMKKYKDTALELLKAFGAYQIEQVPREENAEADILSKLGPDSPDHIKAMTQEEEFLEPSLSPGQVLVITLNESDWIDELTMYILNRAIPTDPVAARVVKRRAASYTLESGRSSLTMEPSSRLGFLQCWGIKHGYAAVGYPQNNGQVENTNRTIVNDFENKIMECKRAWLEELPYILWTYRTTPRKATGETPFALTYGFEARALAKTSLLSYRVETFDVHENEESLRAELHLIDERRERAYIRAENYRRQAKSYHDQRVRPRHFKMGD
ncbi:unnamed protein product [Cuscuta campestris]|uniref:Integrase catalytic domain-containing protein n=1 Tax=Cuscuta campestris TaxID=132261 RepID=A0A484KLE5_9ASTE|nr:unnamed protein product [Cuscuta campestris]